MTQIDSIPHNLWQDLPAAVFLVTLEPSPRFLAANPAAVNLYGYETENALLARPVSAVFADPCDIQLISASLQSEGKIGNMLSRQRKQNDSAVLWAILDASRAIDKDGQPCALVVVRNAADEKCLMNRLEYEKLEGDAIFDAVAELTFITNANHQIIRCNKAMTSRLGMSYQEIKGKHVYTVFFDDQPPRINPFNEDSREVYIPKLEANFLIRNNNVPATELMVHVMLDITEQKKIAVLSAEREKYYRTLAEKLPIGAYIEQDGCFQWVNSCFIKNTGYMPEEILGRPCLSLVHTDDRETLRKNAVAMLRGETSLPYEYRFIKKDDATIWCIETVVSIMFQGRRATLGTQMDVSGQKMAAEALRISEERYRTIIETIPDAYFEVNLSGNKIFCNEQYMESLGYSWEEMKKLTFRDYMDRKNAALAFKICSEVYRTGKPAKHVQLEIFDKMGNLKIFEHSISLIRDNRGEPVGFRGISRDITEKRQQEILTLHSQKLESVGQLAAGIAHEINTPVQFVGDNIHFMQNALQDILSLTSMLDIPQNIDSSEHPAAHEFIKKIRQKEEEIDIGYLREEIPKAIEQSLDGLQRVGKIMQAMREFSHPGGETMSDLDINKAVESTVTLTRNEWKYSAELTTSLDRSLPPVKCYPSDLNQVILNLIINAVHAVQEKAGKNENERGKIEISTGRKGAEVEISIHDTGCGIPPEIQSRVFDPFFTTKAVGKGTGQGLAIARNIIVRKHGGRIYFETCAGEGTTFYIRLPLENSPG